MATPEILAPAGGEEQLLAAVRCGAEAVYLGLPRFSARRNAANFDGESLARAARYCRARNVKLYVTVNTLVLDDEQPSLEETAELISWAGVYGVILQDMAALRLFKQRWPALHRTASTQTAVHNVDGARFLQDMGFDSFVLARELTAEEMGQICAAVSIPAEAFVHGAHCMSLSGACYLSAMLGGRSGNRGLCAQPCRLDWKCGGRDYALSLKDMSLLSHIDELRQAGVQTLKIEGRMKRPEYVAAAVTACKKARAGEPYDRKTLEAVFSRSGFTDGYLTGRRDKTMFGRRTEADAASAGTVLGSLAGLYRRETPLVPVDMRFSMTAGGSSLTVSDGTNTLTVPGPAPEEARTRPLAGESAGRSLRRRVIPNFFVK
ncbi:MAG: U32 family peptidase [Oscillospiraceae bacterium]|nr:U32 family peptidase [Oscillospiraceae bacterium]